VSPFPSLMKGVFSCLRSYPFLFFPASPGGTALANCWLVLSQPHWLVLSQPHLAVLLWQPHWLVLSQPHWLVLSQPHLAVLLWQPHWLVLCHNLTGWFFHSLTWRYCFGKLLVGSVTTSLVGSFTASPGGTALATSLVGSVTTSLVGSVTASPGGTALANCCGALQCHVARHGARGCS